MALRRIGVHSREALFSVSATRAVEANAAAALPPHTLMTRAGLAIARLAQALAPHARCIWIACGPGNNGGDGLVAARLLHEWGQTAGSQREIVVTLHAGATAPPDAAQALADARSASVRFSAGPPPAWDLGIDALLGIGVTRAPSGQLADWLSLLHRSAAPCLCVDVPSGLNADTGHTQELLSDSAPAQPVAPRHTLALLCLKPGLLTAHGRDQAGEIWLDDLRCPVVADALSSAMPATAWLAGRVKPPRMQASRPHTSHKGTRADVAVLGGQDITFNGAGMTGAAVLAARAALHGGAGRVLLGLLADGQTALRWDPLAPELMLRRVDLLLQRETLEQSVVVCGCGGGETVAAVLPQVMACAWRLVLDADALNAIARDTTLQTQLRQRGDRGGFTVITPHPLEAARLLGITTPQVMRERLRASQQLATAYGVVCVLKGSGTVIAAPGATPQINPTGNAALATAGTGDVLAGMVGATLTDPQHDKPDKLLDQVASAVFQHGWLADEWVRTTTEALSAGRLASRVHPMV